jgi:hypothetical protein
MCQEEEIMLRIRMEETMAREQRAERDRAAAREECERRVRCEADYYGRDRRRKDAEGQRQREELERMKRAREVRRRHVAETRQLCHDNAVRALLVLIRFVVVRA